MDGDRRRARGRSLLKHRDFVLLWGGQTVSEVGSQISVLALPLVAVVVLRAGGFQVGLLSAAGLAAIRTAEPAPVRNPERPTLRAQIAPGVRHVLGDPILRNAVGFYGTANFFVVMVETLGPLRLIRELHVRPALVGLLVAMGAAGGVAGGVLAGALARRVGSARISWVAMTVLAAPGLLIPLAGRGWWALLYGAGWVSWTFSSVVAGISLTSYRQSTCPPAMLGRVSAATRWINWGTLPLGGLVGGALAHAVGVRATLWVAAVGGCCSGLWLFFSPLRRMRDIPLGRALLAA